MKSDLIKLIEIQNKIDEITKEKSALLKIARDLEEEVIAGKRNIINLAYKGDSLVLKNVTRTLTTLAQRDVANSAQEMLEDIELVEFIAAQAPNLGSLKKVFAEIVN